MGYRGEESSQQPLAGPMPFHVPRYIRFAFTPEPKKRLGCGVHLTRHEGA
jgi:hypothetical protein